MLAQDVTTSPLKIKDTAKFFKAKANDGSNLIEFNLLAKYKDSSGASQSEDLALNTDNEYITEDGKGYQSGNTYQIINKSDVYSKLYWGTDGDANTLIFEIPIELPEQVKVEGADYNIELFEVSTQYINREYIIEEYVKQLDENKKSKGITYALNSGNKTAEVKSYDGTSIQANTIIPKNVIDTDGVIYAVTSISYSAFWGCDSLTSVVIPDSVTSIGESAFRECSGLVSVEIPDSVERIDYYAFYGCGSLGSVTIPDSVTEIGNKAFLNCISLASVEIPDSVTSIGESVFWSCRSLASVTIGNGVTSIGSNAFYGCSNLTSVVIPDSVTSIGSFAFYSCSSLGSVEIPDSVTSIGERAFSFCTSLESVTIGNGVTSIGSNAFYGLPGDATFYVPADKVADYQTSVLNGYNVQAIPES